MLIKASSTKHAEEERKEKRKEVRVEKRRRDKKGRS